MDDTFYGTAHYQCMCASNIGASILNNVDGQCNGGVFNTDICQYDGKDCVDANERFPECTIFLNGDEVLVPAGDTAAYPAIGNGKCDGWMLNNEKCGYDGGDCLVCNAAVPDISKIGKTRIAINVLLLY